jgi:signal transduction histidine kinase
MKFRIDRRIRIGYFSAYFLLIVCYLLFFSTNNQMLQEAEKADDTKESITKLELLLSQIKDVEIGFREYLLVEDEQFLDPYCMAGPQLESTIKTIRKLIGDNPLQQQKLDKLQILINRRLAIITYELDLFKRTNHIVNNPIKTLSHKGKIITDSIRQEVASLQASQKDLMNIKKPVLAGFSKTIKIINLISLIIASLIAVYSLITYTQENKARRKADEKAILYRKQLEQRIEQLKIVNEELTHLKSIEKFAATGRMARMIAHEVRNPLTNIGLANDQLREVVSSNDEIDMLLDMIKRNSERISDLVSNLLNSTKFVELKLSKVSVNTLISETLEMAKDRVELNAIKVHKNYTADPCQISIDLDKVKIALLNIIVNAIEAMEPNKGILEITTTTSKINSTCIIIIKDNGVGMSEEFLSRLFEPFFTSKEKGNGLGLTNTQNIILHHKGNIAVKSEIGKGTTFIVSLPIS